MEEHEDYWEREARLRTERETEAVRMNPHQFGDQLTLFHAPLGQPEAGTFQGNPHARLYRAVNVPKNWRDEGFRKSRWGHDVGGSDEGGVQSVLRDVSRARSDRGHDTNLGIHWQHDLETAQDMANNLTQYGRHGDQGMSVIIEADHPGTEHVIDRTPMPGGGPPEGLTESGFGPKRNKLTGYKKDWALIHDTVGPHDLDSAMLAEVPVRPGAPMRVHAVHMPDSETTGSYLRNPVQFKGFA